MSHERSAVDMINEYIVSEADVQEHKERVVHNLLCCANDFLQFGTFRDLVRLLAEEV